MNLISQQSCQICFRSKIYVAVILKQLQNVARHSGINTTNQKERLCKSKFSAQNCQRPDEIKCACFQYSKLKVNNFQQKFFECFMNLFRFDYFSMNQLYK